MDRTLLNSADDSAGSLFAAGFDLAALVVALAARVEAAADENV